LLGPEDVSFFEKHGYLRIPAVFTPEEVEALRADLDWMLDEWSQRTEWTGGWRTS
jgi:hypothetical protein